MDLNKGWICLYRGLLDSPIWTKPPIYLKVWTYLLLKAQHSDYNNLKRGQCFVKIDELIEECSYKVGYRTEKPKRKRIWDVLEWLRSSHEGDANGTMIRTTKVTHGLVVTIVKYEVYQVNDTTKVTTKVTTKEQRKVNKGNNKYNNDNNDNNVNKNNIVQSEASHEIETIYSYYMGLDLIKHKKLTESMRKSLKKALKEYSIEELTELLSRHATVCEKTKDNQYPVKKRGLDVFFSQKTSNNAGSPIIYEEYLEGGSKHDRCIANEYKETKEQPKESKFVNYDQRTYNFDELEKKAMDMLIKESKEGEA